MKDNLARLLFTDEGPVVGVDPIMAVEFHACFSRFIWRRRGSFTEETAFAADEFEGVGQMATADLEEPLVGWQDQIGNQRDFVRNMFAVFFLSLFVGRSC